MKRFHFFSKPLTALVLSLVVLSSSFPAFAFDPGNRDETSDVREPDVPFSFTLEGERIEETEAKELLYRAFSFYSKYQAAPYGSKITTTKTAMSSEARSIYSEDILTSKLL